MKAGIRAGPVTVWLMMQGGAPWTELKLWMGRGLVLAVLVALVVSGWVQWRLENQAQRQLAAAWVGHVVVDHLERMAGVWPVSWEQLAEAEALFVSRQLETNRVWLGENRPALAWNSIASVVTLDLDAQPSVLANREHAGEGPPIRVVRRLDGGETDGDREGPNWRIWEWLRKRAGE